MNSTPITETHIEPKPRCRFKHDTELQCKKPPRKGLRYCHQHRRYETCGMKPVKPETIIAKQIATNDGLRERALALRESGVDLLDLTPSLALFAIMREDLADQYKRDAIDPKLVEMLFAVSESNRKTVETIERIRNSTALTAAEMQGISAVLHLMLNDLSVIYSESANADEFMIKCRTKMIDTIKLLSAR